MELKAISYAFMDEWGKLTEFDVRVEWRGAGTWAVTDRGHVLNNKGKWEYEPRPSSRTDAFIQRTRFPLATAMEMAKPAFDKIRADTIKARSKLKGGTK